jgi:hypothetical protein
MKTLGLWILAISMSCMACGAGPIDTLSGSNTVENPYTTDFAVVGNFSDESFDFEPRPEEGGVSISEYPEGSTLTMVGESFNGNVVFTQIFILNSKFTDLEPGHHSFTLDNMSMLGCYGSEIYDWDYDRHADQLEVDVLSEGDGFRYLYEATFDPPGDSFDGSMRGTFVIN